MEAEESSNQKAKLTIRIVFLVVFLDIIGFSIIFPLFPALSEYYLQERGDHIFLQLFFRLLHSMSDFFSLPTSSHTQTVLFGILMGSLYSLLQFIMAPFWGGLSDRWGRRKTLLFTSVGLALSYLLWIFSASFGLLLLARTLGGMMSGNISVASAAVADVTSLKDRSKGMAAIGVALALGFILGPAIGGLSGMWNWAESYPQALYWGINPFSAPALFAFLLGVFNVFLIARKFKETHDPTHSRTYEGRTASLKILWQGVFGKGLANRVNVAYFFFICIFSGMEFTLTFLAVERLGYTSMDNASMFVFIGLLLVLVQGGFVRRKAHSVGDKAMVCVGMVLLIPALFVISYARSTLLLYVGLTLLSFGSAMIVPCLTALASIYSPRQIQGKALGIFRSLGALGRVLGPLLAGPLYWIYGPQKAYLWGGVLLLIPLFLIWRGIPPSSSKAE